MLEKKRQDQFCLLAHAAVDVLTTNTTLEMSSVNQDTLDNCSNSVTLDIMYYANTFSAVNLLFCMLQVSVFCFDSLVVCHRLEWFVYL